MTKARKWLASLTAGAVLVSGIGALGLGGGTLTETLSGVSEITASAATYTYGILKYQYLDDGTIEIKDCDEDAEGELEIPAEIDGVAVTSVGYRAFFNCDALTSITIPDSVTSIADKAFWNCRSLTSITISNSVTSIGNSAFWNCDALTSITIPDSVTSIADDAFSNCESLTSITIPESVTSIGDGAFGGCRSLTSIIVDDNNSFYCSEDGILFDKNLETLIRYPIGKANASYVIPDTVTSIGYGAFSNCDALTSITIPDSVTSIGDYAFSCYDSLTSITIPDSVTSIGDNAFFWCKSLTSVTISDSVTSIGDFAFRWCFALESVTIGSSVTSIGDYAFNSCTSLTDVYYTGAEAQWEAIEIGKDNDYLIEATIHYNATTNDTPTLPTGDLDGDGSITIQDAYSTLMAYSKTSAGLDSGLTDEQKAAADVDGDGKITINDAYKILLYYANTAAGTGATWEDILG